MINNKADFILEYNEQKKTALKRTDVDWSQSRVIFLANSFNTYQQNAINFKDLPIELWEFKQYEGSLITFNQLKPLDSKESIKTISKNKTVDKVSKEIKKYTIEDHFKKGWEKSRELFEELRERVLELDDRINEKFNRYHISYLIDGKAIICLNIRKKKIVIDFTRTRPQDLSDPEKRLKYVNRSFENYNQHVSRVEIDKNNDMDYLLYLLRQVYKNY